MTLQNNVASAHQVASVGQGQSVAPTMHFGQASAARAAIPQPTMSVAAPTMSMASSSQKFQNLGSTVGARAGAGPKMMMGASLGASASYSGSSNMNSSIQTLSAQSKMRGNGRVSQP